MWNCIRFLYIRIIFLTDKSALVSTSARLCCSCIVNDYYTFFLNDLLCNRCCNEDSVVRALIDIHEGALYMYNLRDYIEKSLLRGIFDVIRRGETTIYSGVSQSIAKFKHKATPVLSIINLSLINREREYSESNFIVY